MDLTSLPRVLTLSSAARLDIAESRTRTEVRRGNWRRIARGAVLTRPEEPTRADLAAVGLWMAGDTGALSGWDAVRAMGVGDPQPPPAPVLVLSRCFDNRSVPGLVVRRTIRDYRRQLAGINVGANSSRPLVHAARAAADASLAYGSLSPVRALVTSVVQRRLCLPEHLVEEYKRGPRAGSYFLRLAIEDVLDGAQSIAEAAAIRKLTRPGIPSFEANVEFVNCGGVLLFSPDIYWPELRAILEVDSRAHHFEDSDWEDTLARHNRLTRLGFAVTHYSPSAITSKDESWLYEVQAWLRDRAVELGVEMPPGMGPRRTRTTVII